VKSETTLKQLVEVARGVVAKGYLVCPICGSPDIELRDGAYHCFGKNGGGRFDFLWQLAVVHGRRP